MPRGSFDDEETMKATRSVSNDTYTVETGDSEFYDDEPDRLRGGRRSRDYKDEEQEEVEEQAPRGQQQRQRREEGFKWYRCCCHTTIAFCILLCFAIVALAVIFLTDDDEPQPLATCGDCHCILESETATCPEAPPMHGYSSDFIAALNKQEPKNALSMPGCDPFADSGCDFDPPRKDHGPAAVCGIHYDNSYCLSYKLETYANEASARDAGAFVTHFGPCGICSTTQDLGVYMAITDLTTVAEDCDAKSAASKSKGRSCFEGLGFTRDCADLMAAAAHHRERNCGAACVLSDLRNTPFNGGAPTCALNDCLQCEEDKTASKLASFAGRTPRTSGLLTAVARPCSQIANVGEHLVCPTTVPLA